MYRKIAAQELANFLGSISNPTRIRIIEELRNGELDVSTLQMKLNEAQSKISQNLSVLKAQKVVHERKEGRRVFYSLTVPQLAKWLTDGLVLIEEKTTGEKELIRAIHSAKKKWE
jgi:DNA-binding transcriptional ArsR family regulator